MRITVKTILDFLAAGETEENLLKAYPFLEKKDIIACLQFAAKAIERENRGYKLSA